MRFIVAGTLSLSLALLTGLSTAQRSDAQLAGAWNEGPSGLYFMQRYDVVSRGLEQHIYLFAGSQFVQDPKGDIATVDPAGADPGWRGTWSYAGGTLTLTFGSGRVDTGQAKPDADVCFELADGVWCAAKPLAGGAIDGTYSGGTSFQSSQTATDYDFAPDGTYRVLSGATIATGDTDTDSRVTSAGAGSGRYRIDGLTMTLTAADGTETKAIAVTFGPAANGARPDHIYFNGLLLRRTGD